MADNIVPSLFGLTPETYQQQRAAQLAAEQQKLASAAAGPGTMLNPSLQPLYAQAAQRGQMAGTALGGIFGMEDPQLKMVRDVTQMRQGFDTTTPEGLQAFSQALAAKGYTDLSVQAMDKANQLMKTGAEAQTAKQKIDQEKKLREELNTLGPDATDEDVLRVVRKYGTPDQVMKAVQASMDKKNALAMKAGLAGAGKQDIVSNNGVKAGYVDAKGNFFNNQGKKISDKELQDAQKSHDAASDLLYKLQNITEGDIKNAYGSLADYTTLPGGKLLGSETTVSAQTKINEVGIRNVLNNLSQLKGASSDKEMAQMIKDFPGFQAEPATMKKWMDRAVATTNRFLQRSEQRYGYDTDYGQENRFGTLKGKTSPTGTPGSSRENPIKL